MSNMYGPSTTAPARTANGFAIAGIVLGIVGVFFAEVILGPLAIIFGAIGWSRANRGSTGKGISIAAVVLGILDLVLFFVVFGLASSNNGWFVF